MSVLPPMPPSLRQILAEVCVQHRVKPDEIAGSSLAHKIVAARRAYFWRARQETPHSFPRIASAINKDHTTAIHQVKRVASGVETVEPFRPKNPTRLFKREIEALEMRAAGVDWDDVARQLGVQKVTARSYVASGRRKLAAIREGGKDE